jgi:hypothetical protein
LRCRLRGPPPVALPTPPVLWLHTRTLEGRQMARWLHRDVCGRLRHRSLVLRAPGRNHCRHVGCGAIAWAGVLPGKAIASIIQPSLLCKGGARSRCDGRGFGACCMNVFAVLIGERCTFASSLYLRVPRTDVETPPAIQKSR